MQRDYEIEPFTREEPFAREEEVQAPASPHRVQYNPQRQYHESSQNMYQSNASMTSQPRGFDLKDKEYKAQGEYGIDPDPDSYMWLSCLVCLFCNPVFGGIALLMSLTSRTARADNKLILADRRGRMACQFSVFGIILTFILLMALIGILVHVSRLQIDQCGNYFC